MSNFLKHQRFSKELKKLAKENAIQGKTSAALREDEKWCMYMKYRHEECALPLIEKLYREEAGIMRAERAVEGISRDYLKYAREMAITKNKMDRAQERYEGRKEGREEEKLQIARKMEKMGLSISQVAEGTGLSAETIERL
jgi:predicted transposase/invertase (TIGR01784 family)